MSQAVIGALRVTLGLDSAQFTDGLNAAQKQLQSAGRRLQSIGTGLASVGTGLTAAITAPLIGLGAMAVGEASEMRDALGQVNAALVSMGEAGGRSLEQLKTQADALAGASLFEDDQILRQVTANMLTFGNIAGASFDRAQQAAVDLSARLGQDLQSSAIMVGKALNDPVAGLAALRRVGIQFTADQQAQIKAMQGVGNTAGAQAIMLAELERQFGGSAEAARNAAHPMERMRLSLAAMAGDIGAILLPFVDRMATAFSGLTESFGNLSPGMQQFVVVAGLVAAALGPVLIGLGALVASVGVLLPIIGTIGAPFLAIAAAVAAVGVAFWVFRDDIIPILQSFAASLQENLGPKIAPLWEAIKAAAAAVGEVFSAIFGDGSPGSAAETFKVFGEIIARVLGGAVDVITGAINVITSIMQAFAALLRGDFSSMWSYLGQAVMAATRAIVNAFQALFPEVVSWVRQTYEGVKAWLGEKLFGVFRGVVEKISWVSNAFFKLYDAVVGHSYVPDMVEGIAEWMAKLDAGMVAPARNATEATREAFESLRTDVASIFDRLLTDSERATRQLAQDMEVLDRALAAGQINRTQYERARGGVAAEGLTVGAPVNLSPLADGREIAEALQGGVEAARERMNAAADEFGDRFGSAIESAINGDVRGAFESIFGDMRSILTEIGRALYQAFSQRGEGESIWTTLGKAVTSAISGGPAAGGQTLPGFKAGSPLKVGGLGEMVDIRRPGQDQGLGAMAVHVVPSPYFDVQVEKVSAPLAIQAASTAYGATNADMARAQRRNRQRFV